LTCSNCLPCCVRTPSYFQNCKSQRTDNKYAARGGAVTECESKLQFIQPDWPAPDTVRALVTTRQGGVSLPPFESCNLGLHVGDNPEHVQQNRQRLQQHLATVYKPQWLRQVHGNRAVAAKPDA